MRSRLSSPVQASGSGTTGAFLSASSRASCASSSAACAAMNAAADRGGDGRDADESGGVEEREVASGADVDNARAVGRLARAAATRTTCILTSSGGAGQLCARRRRVASASGAAEGREDRGAAGVGGARADRAVNEAHRAVALVCNAASRLRRAQSRASASRKCIASSLRGNCSDELSECTKQSHSLHCSAHTPASRSGRTLLA